MFWAARLAASRNVPRNDLRLEFREELLSLCRAKAISGHPSKPRMTPRVLQIMRKPLGRVKVAPRTKNEATPGNSGSVIVSVLVVSLGPPVDEKGMTTSSEIVCRIANLRSI